MQQANTALLNRAWVCVAEDCYDPWRDPTVDWTSACIACVAGKYVTVNGSDAAWDCIDCEAGKYSDVAGHDTASDHIDCAAGWYSPVNGSSACIACVVGKYVTVNGSGPQYLDSLDRLGSGRGRQNLSVPQSSGQRGCEEASMSHAASQHSPAQSSLGLCSGGLL